MSVLFSTAATFLTSDQIKKVFNGIFFTIWSHQAYYANPDQSPLVVTNGPTTTVGSKTLGTWDFLWLSDVEGYHQCQWCLTKLNSFTVQVITKFLKHFTQVISFESLQRTHFDILCGSWNLTPVASEAGVDSEVNYYLRTGLYIQVAKTR